MKEKEQRRLTSVRYVVGLMLMMAAFVWGLGSGFAQPKSAATQSPAPSRADDRVNTPSKTRLRGTTNAQRRAAARRAAARRATPPNNTPGAETNKGEVKQ